MAAPTRSGRWFLRAAALGAVVVVATLVYVAVARQGEEPVRRAPELDPQTKEPKDPAVRRRMMAVKVAAFNFVASEYAGGPSWPARVEDILPKEIEGTPVDPSAYRLAPAADLSEGRSLTPVVYEAVAESEGGYLGLAEGSVRWVTPEVLRKVVAGRRE